MDLKVQKCTHDSQAAECQFNCAIHSILDKLFPFMYLMTRNPAAEPDFFRQQIMTHKILPFFLTIILIMNFLAAKFSLNSDSSINIVEVKTMNSMLQKIEKGSSDDRTKYADKKISSPDSGIVSSVFEFGNPAGCSVAAPNEQDTYAMLANVQAVLGEDYDLSERRQTYIWNGEAGTMLDVIDDPFAFEFVFNSFQHPLTYRGDQVATIFLTHGFAVWFREYGGNFRLLAVPMSPGVFDSPWAEYVRSYWRQGGLPNDDTIYPVMKKLPCQWMIDEGYVSSEQVHEMFDLNWGIPDYLTAGQQYLASTCAEANKISREKIEYWDASSMCGPLSWTIMRDANGFPYQMGSWFASASTFTAVNPKFDGQPWGSFDPDTFDLIHIDTPMAGYNFEKYGDLYPGDILYSYSTLYYFEDSSAFDHIFLVGGIDDSGSRLSVSNMVRNYPYDDCFIAEVVLYTPGDRTTGVINYEWNGNGFGNTGFSGFDIFRWK